MSGNLETDTLDRWAKHSALAQSFSIGQRLKIFDLTTSNIAAESQLFGVWVFELCGFAVIAFDVLIELAIPPAKLPADPATP